MAFNGSGVFVRLYNWVNDAASNIKIRADRMDNEMNGFATGLSTCITKDGQTTITANLPMASFRHTNVGNGASRTDYPSLGQAQDGKLNWADGGGTADAITAAYSIPITALVDGQICFVRATAANTTTTPTFSPNGLTARTIVKVGGQALVAGDIRADGHELILRYDLSNTRWELINPSTANIIDGVVTTAKLADKSVTPAKISTSFGITPTGRLTLTSATPVLTSDVTASTSIYYTPYTGDYIPIYDGSSFVLTLFSELTNTTTDNTKNPAAVANNSNYDLFVWNDAGTIRLGRGPAWTSDTARGTGAGTTELERINGILVNKIAITNGPAAQRGTYVGTVRSNGSAQIDVTFGGTPASGGSNARINLWNMYNRVEVSAASYEADNSWAYTTASFRSMNNSANNRVSLIRGLNEDSVHATVYGLCAQSSGTNAARVGVGLNSTTAASGLIGALSANASFSQIMSMYSGLAGLGFNYLQAIESGNANYTFYGDNGSATNQQSGIVVMAKY